MRSGFNCWLSKLSITLWLCHDNSEPLGTELPTPPRHLGIRCLNSSADLGLDLCCQLSRRITTLLCLLHNFHLICSAVRPSGQKHLFYTLHKMCGLSLSLLQSSLLSRFPRTEFFFPCKSPKNRVLLLSAVQQLLHFTQVTIILSWANI